jgi:hypothetical protein
VHLFRLTVVGAVVVAGACSFASLDGLAGPRVEDAGAPADSGVRNGATTDAPPSNSSAPDADAAPLPSYRDEVLADAPIAYFRFEEGANATVAKDEMGQHDGAYLGLVELGVPGAMPDSHALHLTGSDVNTGVRLADFFDNAADAAFTIEVWLDIDAIDTNYRRVLWKATDAGLGYQIAMSTAENVTLAMYGTTTALLKSDTFPTQRWVYVVWTFNGRAISLYVDGVLQKSVPAQPNLPDTPADIFLGETSEGFNQLRGSLDEVALYGRVLPDERITAHFAASKR